MKLLTVLIGTLSCLSPALQASLLVDRPLPVANLNNAAGANQSNVAWRESVVFGSYNWTFGDDFSVGSTGESYTISDLRLWVVGNAANDSLEDIFSSLSLFGGAVGSTVSGSASCDDMTGGGANTCLSAAGVSVLSTIATAGDLNATISPVTYINSEDYQAQDTTTRTIWEVTFNNLNWAIDGGVNYAFYLTGDPGTVGNGGNSPTLHSSNAALSGNAQDGADGLIWELAQSGSTPEAMEQWDSVSAAVWNKQSDVNVQVFGTATPEPATIGLVAFGLLGCALVRRRLTA